MKVLIVSDTIHAGGAETFVLRLAKKLNEMGITAHILSLNPDMEDKVLLQQYPELTVHRVRLPLLRWIKRFDRLLRLLHINFSLQAALNQQVVTRNYLSDYHLFHTHLMPVDLLFARIKKKHPIVVLSTLHGDYNDYEAQWQADGKHKLQHWPYKVAFIKKFIDNWVYISAAQKKLFLDNYGFLPKKLHQIYNGYEPLAPLPEAGKNTTREQLHFIMVARGIPQKGWSFLLEAFSRISGNHRLVLVGKGQHLTELQQQYRSDSRILFAGFHPNPVELIATANVFVFPSIYQAESLPTVVIEALCCGVPVISTAVGEVPQMLLNPQTGALAGMLVTPTSETDIVAALVQCMEAYITNRQLLQAHAAETGGAFKKFSMEACSRSYLSLYQQTCSASSTLTCAPVA